MVAVRLLMMSPCEDHRASAYWIGGMRTLGLGPGWGCGTHGGVFLLKGSALEHSGGGLTEKPLLDISVLL